jgi:hypothetical protein
MNYQEQCVKYFAPLDEISEAINNEEGITLDMGVFYSFEELLNMIAENEELDADLIKYCS